MGWLALDIGGANLKVADGAGYAASQSFPLWKTPHRLSESLSTIIARAPQADRLAVTMTGELADCFQTKTEGVTFILDAVERAADGRHTRVYLTDGALVSVEEARRTPLLAAASNWHALARFAGRFAAQGGGLLVDIGSTTCDVIPLLDGRPAASATTDTERLAAGELVYTGVRRSPVCAIVGAAAWRGRQCPVAQEVFATTWDVYVTLGDLPEDPQADETADGRPATRIAARDRLARCVCADRDTFDAQDAKALAGAVAIAQTSKIGIAASQVLRGMAQPPRTAIISGLGEFLARRVVERLKLSATLVSLSDLLGPVVSQSAPAHALAVVAAEWEAQRARIDG
jgi:hypothetical protein